MACNCRQLAGRKRDYLRQFTEINLLADEIATPVDWLFSHLWWDLVQPYSGKELSHSEDKLAALAGIAKRLAPRDDDVYINGLWRHSLVHDLHWQCISRDLGTRDLTSPSWSWASLTGLVRMRADWTDETSEKRVGGKYQDLEILDMIPQGDFQNPWTSITVLSLSVRGFLVSIELHRHEHGQAARGRFWTSPEHSYDWHPDIGDSEFFSEAQEKFNAALLITTKRGYLGLILSQMAGEPHTYRRLGLFNALQMSAIPKEGFVFEGAELSTINLV